MPAGGHLEPVGSGAPVEHPIAFVLGGGGLLGAAEVGMLAALAGAGIEPDLVLGTSIGGINGAFVAAHPGSGVTQLGQLWQQDSTGTLLGDGLVSQLRTLRRTLISLHSNDQLESLLSVALGASTRIEDLPTPFGCVASCIETASATWFEHGPLVPALLASAAVPGLFGPVVIEGRHYFDGGLVDSIPLGRAVERGARTIFVLQVGRIERPLEPPRTPAAVARVSFEIARRHRFTTVLHGLPPGVSVHVLPTGAGPKAPPARREHLRARGRVSVAERITRAETASRGYLRGLDLGSGDLP